MVEESPAVSPPEELCLPSIALDITEEHNSFEQELVNYYNDQSDIDFQVDIENSVALLKSFSDIIALIYWT